MSNISSQCKKVLQTDLKKFIFPWYVFLPSESHAIIFTHLSNFKFISDPFINKFSNKILIINYFLPLFAGNPLANTGRSLYDGRFPLDP